LIALIQRVSSASVTIDSRQTASIDIGLLVLLGVERSDCSEQAVELASRVCTYRVFPDEQGRMNLDVCQAGGSMLLVPQFTLAADTSKGRRPGFSSAATPEVASLLFDEFCECVQKLAGEPQRGKFGADMKVALVNDGPVTFRLASRGRA